MHVSTDVGSCSIQDVTSYCCAAVGGNLTQIALPDGTGSPEGVMGTECESSAYVDSESRFTSRRRAI